MPVAEKLDTLQRVELGEGVEVELLPASPLSRGMAWLIDAVVLIAAFIVLGILTAIIGFTGMIDGMGGIASGIGFLLVFAILWGYHVVFEASRRGATPGKRALGLRVVTTGGARVGWTPAILRNLLRVVDSMPVAYLTGICAAMMNRKFQRLGDLVAGTVVIYDRRDRHQLGIVPVVPLAILPQPPPVALTREERQALIRFAERAVLWSDGRRQEIANQVSDLTGTTGLDGVVRLAAMGLWLRDS